MKRLIHLALRKLGYRIVRIADGPRPSEGLDPFLKLLKRFGFAPKHILDIGANRGLWTREAIKFFPDAHYTLVEPQEHLKSHIQDLLDGGFKIRWVNAGASNCAGILPFTITSSDGSCSFAPTAEQARTAGFRQMNIPVMTVNEIVAASGQGLPDLVKIDAEGLDLKVLAGASDVLGKSDIFLVEAVLRAGGGYSNSFAAVIAFMVNAGYRLVEITDMNRSPKHDILWLCELAFLRNGSPLFDTALDYE
jgi:FkbM family methyltransferase